jgi:hypothetical protein
MIMVFQAGQSGNPKGHPGPRILRVSVAAALAPFAHLKLQTLPVVREEFGFSRAIPIVRGLCGSMSSGGLHWSPFAVSKHNPLKVI